MIQEKLLVQGRQIKAPAGLLDGFRVARGLLGQPGHRAAQPFSVRQYGIRFFQALTLSAGCFRNRENSPPRPGIGKPVMVPDGIAMPEAV